MEEQELLELVSSEV
uniref:Uncharacterized protein n=1 Tax=Rhizophora mucronata TaxID=61149 RepID=A0A2P2PVD5_RHIMU